MNTTLPIIQKAALSGAITAAASMVTTGMEWQVPAVIPFTNQGQLLPLWCVAAVSGVMGSFLNDGAHWLIRHEIPITKKAQDDASLYLGALIGGATYMGAVYMLNPYLVRDVGATTLVLTGILAETTSNFVADMLDI